MLRTFAGPRRVAPAGLDPSAEQRAYRIIADVAGTQREYVTFGTDMSGAAQGARERLGRLHPGAVLREICLFGSAL